MVPDELGTEADEFLNQRLMKKDKDRRHQYSQKRGKQWKKVDSIGKYLRTYII
jgi:hypothetical protein